MSRNRFPYPPDQEVILAFMRGTSCEASDWLSSDGQHLEFSPSAPNDVLDANAAAEMQGRQGKLPNATVAFYAPDGTMMAQLGSDIVSGYSVHVVNHIATIIGLTGVRIERDGVMPKFFIDGAFVKPGQPFVLIGPLGIRAWRAALAMEGSTE